MAHSYYIAARAIMSASAAAAAAAAAKKGDQARKLARLSHIAEKERARGRPVNTRAHSDATSVIQTAQRQVFGALGLEDVELESSARSRTHMNPLSIGIIKPLPPPASWGFADATKPLIVDVGCAAGRFSLLMASQSELALPDLVDVNHLGLEIKPKLVERANTWAQAKQLAGRVQYLQASANASLAGLCKGYPGPVRCVCVQFPDPHFKRKHHKRRVVDAAFLGVVVDVLEDNGYLFVQSDVEEAAAQMRDRSDLVGALERVGQYSPRDVRLVGAEVAAGSRASEAYWTEAGKRALLDGGGGGGGDYGDWLLGPNPLGVPTEREVQNEALGLPIYRALFRRKPRAALDSAV